MNKRVTIPLTMLFFLLMGSGLLLNMDLASAQTDLTGQTETVMAAVESFFTQTAVVEQQIEGTRSVNQAFSQALTATAVVLEITLTPQPTIDTSLPQAEQVALVGVSSNDEWIAAATNRGYEMVFDNVPMLLVPAGCYQMGNESGAYGGDADGGIQCFYEPFWVDKFEVSQAQFTQLGGTNSNGSCFVGENRPVECITWFEARDYCVNQRRGRLPTEAEWEYVARGPDSLIFPWGNTWIASNTITYRSSSDGTEVVDSVATGRSWVGAVNIIGNVKEWTASVFADYPYNPTDGREDVQGRTTGLQYALRGSSWFVITASDIPHSATRGRGSPALRTSYIGFRCIRPYDMSTPAPTG